MERIPQLVALAAPRGLTQAERGLLDFLLTSPIAHPEIRQQARAIEVTAECDCGCRSIGLAPDPQAPSTTFDTSEATYPGRVDVVDITAHGKSTDGTLVEIVLHIVEGRIRELEVWDGTFEDTRGAMPDPATLELEVHQA